ncbi:MAG TPA: transglutaminase family protein [Bryobacteraceae bacterium]|jgi:transglutaminase-like putative cysteine protease
MFFTIRHLTRFRYDAPVSESLMEVRMHPRTEGYQRCLSFELSVDPRARVNLYRDYLGNSVHHFDVPGKHTELRILAEALVEMEEPAPLPEALEATAWDELDALVGAGDYWETLHPSQFASPGPGLEKLIRELNVRRRSDPLSFMLQLNSAVNGWFEYVPKATRVDSPIEHAIEARKGVCQDFAHILIALARHVKIPCRYVSGYVHPRESSPAHGRDGATHAWVEALMPGLGWVGFDPTSNLIAGARHIRTALGRDYADVPPTRGIFKGAAASELTVSVRVAPSEAPPPPETELRSSGEWVVSESSGELPVEDIHAQQQQQQQ